MDKKNLPLHFVGIGGIGMSGIAEVFLNQGYPVSGSDLNESDSTRRLAGLGATIHIGHQSRNVGKAKVVVISSAVSSDNPEVVEAKRLRIPVIPRAEMLGELMRGKTGIAVAGSHGKTTTTSMLATILTAAELDPTLVIGGKVDSLGGNAKLGRGSYVVAEADESDGSFLHLPATYAVVTNIDNDHLDFFGTLEAIENAFVAFVAELPFYGMAAVCLEDPGVRRCLPRFTKPVVTYGLKEQADFYATQISGKGLGSTFQVFARKPGENQHFELGQIELRVPGMHNVLNALGAIAIASSLGIEFKAIGEALRSFAGVKRRFEIRWQDEGQQQSVVDDYAHHPTEIAATLDAARSFWRGRIITIFQPHRYSRTLHCRDGFLSAFQKTDVLWVCDIYPAGEEPIPGVTAGGLCEEIRNRAPAALTVEYIGEMANAVAKVRSFLKPGDLILCLGAGSITKLPDQLVPLQCPR